MLLDLQGEGPLYQRVYATLRRQILDGHFVGKGKLPGTRSVARALGVSRTVVLAAYEQLESEGYTRTRVGSGTFVVKQTVPIDTDGPSNVVAMSAVRGPLPEVPLPRRVKRMQALVAQDCLADRVEAEIDMIDLTDAAVSYDEQALKSWRRSLTRAMDVLPMQLPGNLGALPLRETLLEILHRERGVVANVDDILVVGNAQQARDLIARALVDGQSRVGVPIPCDPGVRRAFVAAGAHVVPCHHDAEGLDIAVSASMLEGARALHVAPACHMPSGAAMSHARCLALLEWAYARPTWIVEEDALDAQPGDVRTRPALQSLDEHERVVYYTNNLVRAVYPAAQLGCIVVPPVLRERFLALKDLTDHEGMALRQYAWADYLASGEHARSMRRQSQALTRKCRALNGQLAAHFGTRMRIESQAVTGRLLLHLPRLERTWVSILLEEALRVGLRLQTAANWYVEPPAHVTLMLHYMAMPETVVDEVVERLALAYRNTVADVRRAARARLTG